MTTALFYNLSNNPFQLDYAVTAMDIPIHSQFVIRPVFCHQCLQVRFLDLNQHNKEGIRKTLTFGLLQLLHVNKASLIVAGAESFSVLAKGEKQLLTSSAELIFPSQGVGTSCR